jgi:L-aspartate semialdehyde sulfurtransferase
MIYTYMGTLKPRLGNANYSSAGQLSPLLKDPHYRTIGIGTKIFLGGGVGYVAWHGTQHNPCVPRKESGVPQAGAGTLAVIGDLKQMKSQWLLGTSMLGYGSSLIVGIGVPIPVLNEDVISDAARGDDQIYTQVIDYSHDYPHCKPGSLCEVSYAQLKTGRISVEGKEVPTGALSSYSKAREISQELKSWIAKGEFLLTEPVARLPGAESGYTFAPLKERPLDQGRD